MKKIGIHIKDHALVFSYKSVVNKEKNDLVNTNIISNNELIFSEEYIKENEKIVSIFVKELCIEKDIHAVEIAKIELSDLILKLLKKNEYVTSFCIKENCNLTYAICEELSHSKYIKFLSCFSIPTFMLEMLDDHDIKVESRNETFFTSDFMLENNLQQFSKMYYKSSIRFAPPLSEEDIEDFISFCKINRYLKTIHIYTFDNEAIDTIIQILKKNKLKNIKMIVHDDSNNVQAIEYLKKLNKKYKSKYNIQFKIAYSESYLKDNIFKQIILNTLKICGLITIVIVIGIISYVSVTNYKAMQDLAVIQENIDNVIKQSREEQQAILEQNSQNIDQEQVEPIVNTDIAALLSINSDVAGWLKVNNTNIDYPVVKTTNNNYYLKHNLYKEKDKNGWIFMDYRNSTTSKVNKHTIIYGHNMYYSGVMFGTLHKAYQKSWYTKEENQIIEFNTLYKNLKFKIFSIYKIDKTSDYLVTNFSSDEEFLKFVNMIQKRSIYKFDVEVNEDDKILTLSTCTGENSRLVVHAKLVEE